MIEEDGVNVLGNSTKSKPPSEHTPKISKDEADAFFQEKEENNPAATFSRTHDALAAAAHFFRGLRKSPAVKRAPKLFHKDEMCPFHLKARRPISKKSKSQTLDAPLSMSGSTQVQSEEVFNRGMLSTDDSDWDELDESNQATQLSTQDPIISTQEYELHSDEAGGTSTQIQRHRHQLEMECTQYEEEDERVRCMVEIVERSTKDNLTIIEEDETVKVIQSVTGKVIFQYP